MNNDQTVRLLDATSRIVAAYISRPEINLNDLPVIMEDVYKLMTRLITAPAAFVSGRRPAVPIDESIHDDYLVCLEDGRHLSMLKRHLKTTYGLTVEEYKERWGLPQDYPTVAAAYTRRRRSIAKTIGLGKTGQRKRRHKTAYLEAV